MFNDSISDNKILAKRIMQIKKNEIHSNNKVYNGSCQRSTNNIVPISILNQCYPINDDNVSLLSFNDLDSISSKFTEDYTTLQEKRIFNSDKDANCFTHVRSPHPSENLTLYRLSTLIPLYPCTISALHICSLVLHTLPFLVSNHITNSFLSNIIPQAIPLSPLIQCISNCFPL